MATAKTASVKKGQPKKAAEVPYRVVNAEDLGLSEDQRAQKNIEGFSQYIRALQQNWRQGTVACKGRSDVAFSNKKPWKQKGTGRARAGSARSPLWRKGGVIFGPQPRTRTLQVSKALKRSVCNSLLWDFLDRKHIVLLDWTPQETPKTAHAAHALKEIGLAKRDIIFFVTPADMGTHTSFANIPNVRMLLYDQWNAYDVSGNSLWMVLQKDMDAFKEMVQQWM